MDDLKVLIYTTETCGACKMLLKEVPKSKYKDAFQVEVINDSNREVLMKNNVNSVPAIFIQSGETSNIIVGYRPIGIIDDLIRELKNY